MADDKEGTIFDWSDNPFAEDDDPEGEDADAAVDEIDQAIDAGLSDDPMALRDTVIGVRFPGRAVRSRNYPLTRYEKAKVLATRARILEHVMGGEIKIPANRQNDLESLEKEYLVATVDKQPAIRDKIFQLYEEVFGKIRSERRLLINLTDAELELDTVVPPGTDLWDPIRLAKLEFKYRKLPMRIERIFPGEKDAISYDVNDLIGECQLLFVEASKDTSLPAFSLAVVF